jgi:long-chain acyl-CoA synthetase
MTQTIELPILTLQALFERSISHYGPHPALQFAGEEPITYSQLGEKVASIQKILRDYGIKEGDKVALYSENMPNWGAVYFAATTMGAVIVPILHEFLPSEARHIAVHAECKAAFISQKLFETMLDEVQPPNLNLLVILDTLKVLEKLSTPSAIQKVIQKGEKEFNRAMDKLGKESDKGKAVPVQEEDLAAIIYTSGTTGSSKGVMLSHKNIVFDAVASQQLVDIKPGDRFLSILPLAHTYECTVGMIIPLLCGASVHYIKKPPTPTVLIRTMAQVRPDFMLSVPLIMEKIYKNKVLPTFQKNIILRTLYRIPWFRKRLNEAAGKKLIETFGGKIRFFGIGGAGVSPAVESFLREAKFPYCIGYGLTETAPVLAGTNPSQTKYRAIGPAIPGVELELRDIDESGSGILWARGPNVMVGYYKDAEKTAQVMDEEGWFNTEDIGYFDEDGYFFMSGRAKNIIIGSSGENIYPEQIEAVINLHETVADSLVYDDNGTLSARIFLDYDKLDELIGTTHKSETKVHEKIEKLLETIKQDVNSKVPGFSRIHKVIEQKEPFVKTPTKKIKRYLYTESDDA